MFIIITKILTIIRVKSWPISMFSMIFMSKREEPNHNDGNKGFIYKLMVHRNFQKVDTRWQHLAENNTKLDLKGLSTDLKHGA